MTNANILICIFLLLIYSPHIWANMASPRMPGSTTSEAYSSRHIDILHEQITIKHINPYEAKFTILYTIKTDKSGKTIPLIFDTNSANVGGNETFAAWVNDIEIPISDIPSTYENKNALIWLDSLDNHINFPVDNVPNFIGYKYFEVNLSEGVHVIRVEYTASASVERGGIIEVFNYTYNLAPARYWKSFGTLAIEIDTTPLDGEYLLNITSKIDTINKGTSVSHWHFTELPSDAIYITFFPRISKFSQLLIGFGAETFSLIFIITLIVFHVRYILRYRIANPEKKYSPALIAGSLVLPFLFFSSYIFFTYLLDWIIGEFATGQHGYIYFIYILYPITVVIYLPIMWLIDKLKKRRIHQE